MTQRIKPGTPSELTKFTPGITRAGAIPYTEIEGKIYWLMGISQEYRWSDFGGGCRTSRGETPLICLLREVKEESGGLLDKTIERAIKKRRGLIVWKAYTSKGTLNDYLLLVKIPYKDYGSEFHPNSEISHILWLPQKTILDPNVGLDLFHEPVRRYIRKFRKGHR